MTIEFLAADWPATHVLAGTTMRTGGISKDCYASLNLAAHVGDTGDAVAGNRRRLRAALCLPGEPLWLNQTHSTKLVDGNVAQAGATAPTADAAFSHDGRAILGILTADCLPILVCSSVRDEIAAMHCGWRGLAGGIVAGTVSKLASEPGELLAWLGPAISQAAYEVGDEVRDVFLAGVEEAARCFRPNGNGRWQADLYRLARLYLAEAGVKRIYGGGRCTYSDPERYYSYRRDGTTGRMASLIWSR